MILFRVISGSRLYGTARPDSDRDFIEVHDRLPGHRQIAQTIVGDVDLLRLGLSRFLFLCEEGAPQALEAMFAPDEYTEIDVLRSYRHAYRANVRAAEDTFASAIRQFEASAQPKTRAHARRLADNLEQLRRTRRFDPIWRAARAAGSDR
ncbi:DNA polymerase beta superfamily protein [Stackebrandtia soli]|uniref:DNA polymerase beta superfamily protein n=1 Tax=Stackebrandtia soli TaxID=1892856 RepID=UPI0039EA75FC